MSAGEPPLIIPFAASSECRGMLLLLLLLLLLLTMTMTMSTTMSTTMRIMMIGARERRQAACASEEESCWSCLHHTLRLQLFSLTAALFCLALLSCSLRPFPCSCSHPCLPSFHLDSPFTPLMQFRFRNHRKHWGYVRPDSMALKEDTPQAVEKWACCPLPALLHPTAVARCWLLTSRAWPLLLQNLRAEDPCAFVVEIPDQRVDTCLFLLCHSR